MDSMKIAVRVPNWIGDTVLSLPALRTLKINYPEAQLWVIGKEWTRDLLASDDLVAGTIPLPEGNDIKRLWECSQELKNHAFDIGLLLTNSFSSAFLFYLSKIPKRWGYSSDGRAVLLTKGVPIREEAASLHQAHFYLHLLSRLGLTPISPDEIKLSLSPGEKETAQTLLEASGVNLQKPLVILNPGAAYGPAKRWPVIRFAELAGLFQKEKGAEILVVGSAGEISLAEAISSALEKKPVILSGKTSLRQLLGILSQAALFVTSDSGPMHMANSLRVPLVAIFGPTDPRVTGPLHEPAVVVKKDVPCWPCSYRSCPYDHRCMMTVSPEEVFSLSQKFL